MTFDAKMPFEKHLCSVYRAAVQRIGITKKNWQGFSDLVLILRYFWSFILPLLEYCSAVKCSAAYSQLILLDRVVVGASFLAGGVLECNVAHRRSVAVLCILLKIKSDPMRSLVGTLPLLHVSPRVTHGASVTHRHSFASHCCRTFQYRRNFCPTQYDKNKSVRSSMARSLPVENRLPQNVGLIMNYLQ